MASGMSVKEVVGVDKVVFLFHSKNNWSAMSARNNLVEDGWLIRQELG